MKHFFEALTSEGKHKELPEALDYFGKLTILTIVIPT